LTLGIGITGRQSYCTQCGFFRAVRSRTWLGIPIRSSTEYRESEYHEFYRKFVSAECSHHWQDYSVAHSCRVGEVRRPMVLRDEYAGAGVGLAPLARLGDRARVAAVLTSFDLARSGTVAPGDLEHAGRALPAIAELGRTSTSSEVEQWWNRHRSLFLKPIRASNGLH
jgi:hypothetical protein